MIRQYYRRYKSNRGRCDCLGKPIPDKTIFKGVVVSEVKDGRVYIGYSLINPNEPSFNHHNRLVMNEIAERRLMSERYFVPLHSSDEDVHRFLNESVFKSRHDHKTLRIPRQIHETVRQVIFRSCKIHNAQLETQQKAT